MLGKLTAFLPLIAAAALISDAALAGHGVIFPGARPGFHGRSGHHFIPPGHLKHSYHNRGFRGTHYEFAYRRYVPPVRVVRHRRVIYGHRHSFGCGHRGYRPGYYSSYRSYYRGPAYPAWRYAGWPRHWGDDFGFFIYYDD